MSKSKKIKQTQNQFTIQSIFLLLWNIIKYPLIGIWFIFRVFISVVLLIATLLASFLIYCAEGLWLIFKLMCIGIYTIFAYIVYIFYHLTKTNPEREKSKIARRKFREEQKVKELEERRKQVELKREKAEQEFLKNAQEEEKITPVTAPKIKKPKRTISTFLNDILKLIFLSPSRIVRKIANWWSNLALIKTIANKRDINRQSMLINFEGDDAKKTKEKLMYEYVVQDKEGKIIKGYFPAFSKVEVHSFLLSEGNTVYSIRTNKWIQLVHGRSNTNKVKIKTKDLIFFLTQLSTYIKAGIPLVNALRILTKQYKNKNYKRIFRSMIYDLTTGEDFSSALEKQGSAFPKLLINMVKASEMTGELPETLDDMSQYFSETEATRKQMITALTYPIIIFVVAIGVGIFIMIGVVPKFVTIYNSMDNSQIPTITLAVLAISNFLQTKWWLLLILIVGIIVIYKYLYKNIQIFRTFMQFLFMHIPGFKDIIIYNEVTMFTKTFASLLKHNVFITDSMEILNQITNNEIYKIMILDTITNLAKGDKASLAFKDQWAFPIAAYEMIVTGEETGQLPEMMSKVSTYYQELHRNAVTRLKTYVEPVLIILLTAMVGVIVLSIVIPMFNMYSAIQG